MKQYVITDTELDYLLKTLEVEKWKGTPYLYSSIAVLAKQLMGQEAAGLKLEEGILKEAHRHFHYHVVDWINNIKK